MGSIHDAQRFEKLIFKDADSACPICGGYKSLPQGDGTRCFGFQNTRITAICTREEHAGGITLNPKTSGYCHKLTGRCPCGKAHHKDSGEAPSTNGHSPNGHKPKADYFAYNDKRAVGYFHYCDEQGQLLYDVVRYEWPDDTNSKGHSKTYRQFHQDGDKWIPGIDGIRRVLYRLPELLAAAPDLVVYIPEGEPKVDALRAMGLIATCCAMGAKKWNKEYSAWLRGRHVVILPDNDSDGREHAKLVHESLQGIAASVRIVALPGLPDKGDIVDWLAAGGTREQLEELCKPLEAVEPGRRLSDVQVKVLEWFWRNWIPRGKISMLDAMPDQGKSLLCLMLAAHTTSGMLLPDGSTCPQGAVILVNLEDDLGDTVKPRLLAAGGDATKVFDLTIIRYRDENGDIAERPFTIPRDLHILEEQIIKHGVTLICLDPLMAILDSGLKSSSDQDVRQALTPLARLLENTRCACVIVRHFNKGSSDNSLIRGAGSMGIVGAARAQLFIVPDPDDATRHILALGKHNLSAGAANLAYRIVVDEESDMPVIHWDGTSTHTTAELLATTKPSIGRQEILRIIEELGTPVDAHKICEKAPNLTYEQARKLLQRMHKAGELVLIARGLYDLPRDKKNTVPNVPTVPSVPSVPSVPTQEKDKKENKLFDSSFSSDWDSGSADWDSAVKCPNGEGALEAGLDVIGTLGTLGTVSHSIIDAISAAYEKIAPGSACVVDLETCGLDERNSKVIAIQLGTTAEDFTLIDMRSYYAMPAEEQEEIRYLLQDLFSKDVLWIGHNLKFDAKFLLAQFGVRLERVYDTMIVEKLVHCGEERRGRKRIAYNMADVAASYKLKVSKAERSWFVDLDKRPDEWSAPFPQEQVDYMCQDIVIPYIIREKQQEQVQKLKLARVVQIEHDVLPSVVAMEDRGVLIDTERWRKVIEDKKPERAAHNDLIQGMLDADEQTRVNLNSPKLKGALKAIGVDVESTGREALEAVADQHPVVAEILAWRKLDKFITSFGDGVLKKVDQDGRIRANFDQMGSDTGRIICSDPNLQQMPKPKGADEPDDIRACFVAPAGYKMLVADLSNIELRILADLSKDENMLQPFAEGKDLHSETAQIMGVSRSVAKTINFGLVYGMGAQGLAGRVGVTVDEAERLMAQYFAAYPGVAKYLRITGNRGAQSRRAIAPSGRRRVFPFEMKSGAIERRAKNYPMQVCCADILKIAMSLLHKRLHEEVHIVLTIHDEIVLEAPDGHVEQAKATLKQCMVEACREFLKDVAIPEPDVLISNHWVKG